MASIEEFESMLKEVVNAKRLSASKMEKLTEVSMKLMENDTRLVSILYRTHKSLRASAKISSLYIFDAICRAARSQVVKRNLTGDINAEKGNCATFLLKMDNVLDGLFQDILSSGVPEAKEKTRKILDIWTKANTFPANVLTRVGMLGKEADSVAESNSKETKRAQSNTPPTPISDPRKHPTPPTVVTPPPAANSTTPSAEAAQAALLALLTTAAAANNASIANQTIANNTRIQGASPPQAQSQAHLGQLQFALLQQLAKTNNGFPPSGVLNGPLQPQAPFVPASFAPGTSTFPTNLNMSAPSLPGPSSISFGPSGTYTYGQGEQFNKFSGMPDASGHGNQYFDNRRGGGNQRGFREGFRGRGRGVFSGKNERDREPPWDRASGGYNDGGPPSIRRRFDSRSQSPPQRRRDDRPYSPPQQPSQASSVERRRAPLPGASEPGKDEFGRDVRAGSEGAEESDHVKSREGMSTSDVPSELPLHQSNGQHGADVLADSAEGSKGSSSNSVGLESYDISTFDPTSPESWKTLGDAFQATHGYVPSQEELMQLVMASMGMMMGMGMDTDVGASGVNAATATIGTDMGFGDTGGAKGSKETGWGWNVAAHDGSTFARGSEAIVLGPDTEEPGHGQGMPEDTSPVDPDVSFTSVSAIGGTGPGGKMQKIGDRWMFVRDGV